MSTSFFLYRRLARWISCEFNLSNKQKISLKNKYEVASFKDVFCHPFYWQVFQWIEQPPKLIVDCGAHCGHFSILADICFKSKFANSDPNYILIEPNPYLIPVINKNLNEACINDNALLKQGLLGPKSGSDKLYINHKNYLATGLYSNKNSKPCEIPYINLSEIVQDRNIDLMKIDIEGGEFEFIRFNLDILQKTKLLFMELHEAPQDKHLELFQQLQSVGLNRVSQPVEANGQQLIIFQRR
ncbi:MAG: FkbM family methyltransferase [Richelia sp. RM2_1_2]|nr:FkbM family methyltransferase [Richelia sp. RM2_1_2]